VPMLHTGSFDNPTIAALVVTSVIAVVMFVFGFVGYRKRDMVG